MKWSDLANDDCPIARTMSLLGDRWTLLIVRDCFLGVSRFDQFQASIGMTRHVLADRLDRLVEADILQKRAYSDRPARYDYVLTAKGQDLQPAMRALFDWGRDHMPIDRSE